MRAASPEAASCPNLVEPYYKLRVGRWRRSPCNSNRASSLGGDCERQAVYDRINWKNAERPSDELIIIFGEGDKHELAVLRDLVDAGLEVQEQQVSLDCKEHEITGHIDGVVIHEEVCDNCEGTGCTAE